MKLSITIPAYNEEEAIAAIIERCVAVRPRLLAESDLDDVEIIVVSDGSTDRTVEIAQRYADEGLIRLVAYTPNAGYGSALKRGFRESDGDLVSFLDADGTCDPNHFVPLVNACLREHADVACGCRMTSTSKMPAVRRLGNRIFRTVINAMAQSNIRDSASGMRVIRKRSLPLIYPLPDGMHFTPAMSSRAALDKSIKMVEIDMHYEERIGESKLSVVHDGMRFLKVIVDTALTYRPLRLFGAAATVPLVLGLILGLSIARAKFIDPGYEHLPHWFLFRMMTALVCAGTGLTLIMVGLVTERIALLVQRHKPAPGRLRDALLRPLRNKRLFAVGLLVAVSGVLLNVGTVQEWIQSGRISPDNWWAYVITGGFLVVTGAQLMAIAILDRVLLLLSARQSYLEEMLAIDLPPVMSAPNKHSLALPVDADRVAGPGVVAGGVRDP